MKAYDIVAYIFQADLLNPDETAIAVARMIDKRFGTYAGIMGYETVEEYLDRAAEFIGVERLDEWTFDSDDFPKVVFADQLTESDFIDLGIE